MRVIAKITEHLLKVSESQAGARLQAFELLVNLFERWRCR
jgi:hypothetical protein